ncbi:hypothetical protein [Bradyrhizobium sp. AUGA SZCCT0240]|uniref:NADPH-dependent F420 reductase n=1 Tax=Bradyrhizobium sp. AUGA SZCCT0240 TaxID=2807669 RepID=UPI0028A18D56|nr:hypothetical protein [Bradyrhizobium sp. AUGA SZCCT0240]
MAARNGGSLLILFVTYDPDRNIPCQLASSVQAPALAGLPEWSGRILIDANNPIEAPLFKPVDLHGRVSSELVADLVPGARVVKAFNHLRAEVLAADPRSGGGRRVLFYSGNDGAAKAEVAALIERIGFVGIDLGSLAVGGKLAQFPGGPLPNQDLIKIA